MSPQRALYLFAHQDDELLILAKLRDQVRRGDRVQAVWITDGGKGGDAAKRQAESRQVMRLAGVPEASLAFLDFPDGDSIRHISAIDAAMRDRFAAEPIDEIVSPAFEGGHMDHDVAALMAARLAGRIQSTPLHHEYPLYNRFRGRTQVNQFLPNAPSPVQTLSLDRDARDFLTRAAKVYRTQRWVVWGMVLIGVRRKLIRRGVIWRAAPEYDFLNRPAGEPCGYETSWTHRARFNDWVAAAGSLLTQPVR